MPSSTTAQNVNDTMKTKKSGVFRSALIVTAFSLATRSTAFLFKIYLSRTLGAEVMGLYQIALTVFFLFIALSTGGISTVLSRKIAERNAVNQTSDKLLTTSLLIALSLSTACTLIAYLCLPYLDFLITDERAIPLLKIMLPALFSTTFYIVIRGWFWGNKHFFDYSLSELIEEILRVGFTLFFVLGIVSGINGENGLALAFTVSDFIVMIIITVMFFLRGGNFTRCGDFKEILKPALPLTVMRIIGSFAGTAVALIIPSGLIKGGMTVSEATTAIGRVSSMANPLLFAPNAIINSLAVVLIPEMSEANYKKDFTALKEQIKKGISLSLVLSGAFMLLYLALGKELTTLIFNDTPSGEYLEKASVLLMLMPINLIASSAVNSVGLEKKNFLSYGIGITLMLLASFILPRYLGLNAVIIADVLFLATTSLLNLYFLQKHINSSFGIRKIVFTVAVFSILCAILANNIFALLEGKSLVLALIIAIISGTVLYGIIMLAFKVINVKELGKLIKNK